jgi:hypothetical protein
MVILVLHEVCYLVPYAVLIATHETHHRISNLLGTGSHQDILETQNHNNLKASQA